MKCRQRFLANAVFAPLTIFAALFLPISAKADTDDGKMIRCASVKSAVVCNVAYLYYGSRVKSRATLEDKCHNGFDLASSEFVYAMLDGDSPDQIIDSHQTLDALVTNCEDPWKTKARLFRNSEDHVIEAK